jgi:hypothetical protein
VLTVSADDIGSFDHQLAYPLALFLGGFRPFFKPNVTAMIAPDSPSELLAVHGLAWAFGYRKAIADEAESA